MVQEKNLSVVVDLYKKINKESKIIVIKSAVGMMVFLDFNILSKLL